MRSKKQICNMIECYVIDWEVGEIIKAEVNGSDEEWHEKAIKRMNGGEK